MKLRNLSRTIGKRRLQIRLPADQADRLYADALAKITPQRIKELLDEV